jgi:hypothetical protein
MYNFLAFLYGRVCGQKINLVIFWIFVNQYCRLYSRGSVRYPLALSLVSFVIAVITSLTLVRSLVGTSSILYCTVYCTVQVHVQLVLNIFTFRYECNEGHIFKSDFSVHKTLYCRYGPLEELKKEYIQYTLMVNVWGYINPIWRPTLHFDNQFEQAGMVRKGRGAVLCWVRWTKKAEEDSI